LSGWVLDASMVLAWVLPDESSEEADRFFSLVSPEDPLWVPCLWWFEITKALVAARRRDRLTEAEAVRAIHLLGELRVETDVVIGVDIAWRWQTIAETYGLSVYDAAYFELSQRKAAGLATLDEKLKHVAQKVGVPLLQN